MDLDPYGSIWNPYGTIWCPCGNHMGPYGSKWTVLVADPYHMDQGPCYVQVIDGTQVYMKTFSGTSFPSAIHPAVAALNLRSAKRIKEADHFRHCLLYLEWQFWLRNIESIKVPCYSVVRWTE